jgi:hypothetical protein
VEDRERRMMRLAINAAGGVLGRTAALAGAVVLVAAAGLSGAGGIVPQPQCNDRTMVDYLAPFKRMPPAHPPPAGSLQFGPRDLTLRQNALSQIIPGPGGFGYVALVRREHPDNSAQLGWKVSARLQLLRATGRPKRVAAKRSWRIERIEELDNREFFLTVGGRPALYRYLLEFRSANGQLLQRYSQYVRVVPRRTNTSLLIDRPIYNQGEQVVVQVANFGTESVSYGEGGSVSFFDGTTWVRALRIPSIGKRRAIGLGPGEAGICEALTIPIEQRPGLYRIEKRMFTLRGEGGRRIVRQFRIAP